MVGKTRSAHTVGQDEEANTNRGMQAGNRQEPGVRGPLDLSSLAKPSRRKEGRTYRPRLVPWLH